MSKKKRLFKDWTAHQMKLWRRAEELEFIERLLQTLPSLDTYELRQHYWSVLNARYECNE